MLTDIEIAQQAKLEPIVKIAEKMGLQNADIEPYGHYKAKISNELSKRLANEKDGKLVLVTAISPTPAGEGKSTTTVGLAQGLAKLDQNVIVALREPSLGPCMGVKGGAAGGGYSQVLPMEDINLHFTGDIHAITTAHNLLSALIDNHIHQGNKLGIDPRKVEWRRVLDMNDRALRNITIGLGGKPHGMPREDHFDITVASEIMAIMCLAMDIEDLKERLAKIVVAYTFDDEPVTVGMLNVQGAMTALLKDALKPNLVQTIEGVPAFIHGGPFANIAHGCNSIQATKLALKLGDIAITEAGFGADLGAEKFLDIKCRFSELKPDAVVLVATIRALKMHGGVAKTDLATPNLEALEKGLSNLEKHINNIKQYNLPIVVAINEFPTDTAEEQALIEEFCKQQQVPVALSQVFAKGGEGGIELGKALLDVLAKEEADFKMLYPSEMPLVEKIETIATKIYGAAKVEIDAKAMKKLARFEELGYASYPVCIAKTQYSFSDNPKLLGAPSGFTFHIKDVRLSAGAGFIVALAGDIMTMPGLPKVPAANNIDVDKDGNITGLF